MVMQVYTRSAFQLSTPPTVADQCMGPEALFTSDISTHSRYKITADGKWFYPLQPEPRTLAQLAGTPSPQDAALTSGFGFYASDATGDKSQLWRASSDGTRYLPCSERVVRLTGPYTLSLADDKSFFWSTVAVAVTVPAMPIMPRCKFDCPSAGAITLLSAGGVLFNGATTTVSRARAQNPSGFELVPHYGEANSCGVSGS